VCVRIILNTSKHTHPDPEENAVPVLLPSHAHSKGGITRVPSKLMRGCIASNLVSRCAESRFCA